MTAKRRTSYWQRLRRLPAVLAASTALAAATGGVIGAPPHNCVDCRFAPDGVCIPNATTYGYYQTQWRTWPKPLAVSTRVPSTETKLPTQVEPPPAQEDLDNAPRPPASSGDMGETPPVKPATGDEQLPPKTDKPDPFQDDPVQNGNPADAGNSRRETSILIPPISDPAEAYGLIDEMPAVEHAIPSRYDEAPDALPAVARVSNETALRLIETSQPTPRAEAAPARPKPSPPAATVAPDGANPLRRGWGARGESPLREPKVVSQFGGAAPTNPLRR